MSRRLFTKATLLLAGLSLALAGCLGGTGTGAPGSVSGVTNPSVVGGGGTPSIAGSEAAAAGGGSDSPMPPRADADDCMTIGIDGSAYCGPEKREACRIFYVPAPKLKVFSGNGDLPEIAFIGKTTLEGRFYAEVGWAPLSCEDPSCWTWESTGPGNAIRMRLTRIQPAAPALQFYQDAVTADEADGANLAFSGMPIKDGDALEFYATFVEAPFGYSEAPAPLTDAVWEKWGAKCEMGGFKLNTGITYYKLDRPGVPDAIERAGDLIRR